MRHTLNLLRFLTIFIVVLHGSGFFFNLLAIERVRWKLQIVFEGTERPVKDLIERIKIISEGKLKLRYYGVNTLVPGSELHSAVSEGQVDAGFTTPGYLARKIPGAILFGGVPFGPRLIEHNAWMQHGGGEKLKNRIYNKIGLISLQCGTEPPESGGWFNKRHKRIEDLNGEKMRIWGFGGKVLMKFGVTPVALAPRSIIPALKKGEIGSAEFSYPQVDLFFGLNKVFRYNYFPSWFQQLVVHELILNKKQWDSLSVSNKLIFRTSCDSSMLSINVDSSAKQPPAMIQLQKEGTKFMRWQDKDLEKLRKAWHEVAEEESAKDPLFAEVYKSYKSFRDQYAIWVERAYLK